MKTTHFLALTLLVLVPGITFAQNYLVGIPGVDGDNVDFDTYLQAIYVMFISIAALLAVVKIIIAGLKYMFSDIVTQKSQAKKDIQGALIGLGVVLAAVLILTVINPELTRFNLAVDQLNEYEVETVNDMSEEAIATCNNSDICEVLGCTETPGGDFDCSAATLRCASSQRSVQTLGFDRSILCQGALPETIVTQGDEELDRFACRFETAAFNCDSAEARCSATGRTPEIIPDGGGYVPYVACN